MKQRHTVYLLLLAVVITGAVVFLKSYFQTKNPPLPQQQSPKQRDEIRLTDSVTIQIALTNYWIKNQKYPNSLNTLLENKHLSKILQDPVTQQAYSYESKDNQKSYELCIQYETVPNASCEKPHIGGTTPSTSQKVISPSASPTSQIKQVKSSPPITLK